jgi:phage-related protein
VSTVIDKIDALQDNVDGELKNTLTGVTDVVNVIKMDVAQQLGTTRSTMDGIKSSLDESISAAKSDVRETVSTVNDKIDALQNNVDKELKGGVVEIACDIDKIKEEVKDTVDSLNNRIAALEHTIVCSLKNVETNIDNASASIVDQQNSIQKEVLESLEKNAKLCRRIRKIGYVVLLLLIIANIILMCK